MCSEGENYYRSYLKISLIRRNIMSRKNVLTIVAVTMLALATASNAKLMLISVSIDTTEREGITLDGPVDGDGGSDVGTTWMESAFGWSRKSR